jgi:hypothetical protein
VTDLPYVDEVGFVATTVSVAAVVATVSVVVPEDVEKLPSPEYAPVIVSVPLGALVAEQEAEPPLSVAVQRVVDPIVNRTLPDGVPVDPVVASVTVAE